MLAKALCTVELLRCGCRLAVDASARGREDKHWIIHVKSCDNPHYDIARKYDARHVPVTIFKEEQFT